MISIAEVEQNVEQMSLVFCIIAFGLVSVSSHYYEENTCLILKVLTKGPKGENITNTDFEKVYLANSEQKVW